MHGILHLLGFDHEIGAEESIAMAEAERYVLNSLQWKVVPSDALLCACLPSSSPGHNRAEAGNHVSCQSLQIVISTKAPVEASQALCLLSDASIAGST